MIRYLFWYKLSPYSKTQYIYIFAKTVKQANFFWFTKFKIKDMYDYCYSPISQKNGFDRKAGEWQISEYA